MTEISHHAIGQVCRTVNLFIVISGKRKETAIHAFVFYIELSVFLFVLIPYFGFYLDYMIA